MTGPVMTVLEQREVRRVTDADYDDIMSIRASVYDGYDYLPFQFKSLINHPDNEGYATILNGKFVAFCMVSKVDGGETMVTRAGRINKQFEGHGIYKALKSFIKQRQCNGIVCYHAYIAADTNQLISGAISRGELAVLEKNNTVFYKTEHDIRALIEGMNTDMEEVFQSNEACIKLFPETRIICNVVPYNQIFH